MGGKGAVVLGLVAGVVAGGLLVGGAIALVPGPATPPLLSPEPTEAPAVEPTPPASPSPEPSTTGTTPDPSQAVAGDTPSPETSAGAAGAFNIGQPAPPLRLPAVGGGTVDLASLRGKPVWVNLMATWCLPCRDELPLMQGFAARYEDAGLVTLLVDVGEDEAAVKSFLDELNVYLPAALDKDGTAQAEWGATALPVHFWIDKDGIVREWALGGLGPDVMAESLQKILPGETVTP
jgi:thiol-disulfide isomerase/thioredoxin